MRFRSLQVQFSPVTESHVLSWELFPSADTGNDLYFDVEFARNGGQWELLTESSLLNVNLYEDENAYRYNLAFNYGYRVKVTEGSSSEYSFPVSVTGEIPNNLFPALRKVYRDRYNAFRNGGGQEGYLLRRRLWGTACPSCIDPDLGTKALADCSVCYGTGIQYGFYDGHEFYMRFPSLRDSSLGAGADGQQDAQSRPGEYIPYLPIKAGDVWVAKGTGERFLVQQCATAQGIYNTPLYGTTFLAPVSPEDILFQVPISTEEEVGEGELGFSAEDLAQHD